MNDFNGNAEKTAVFRRITAGEYDTVVCVNIAGTQYGENVLRSVRSSHQSLSSTAEVGNCIAGSFEISMLHPGIDFPRMAAVRIFTMAVNRNDLSDKSDWMQMGEYFIDTRQTTYNDDGLDVLTLTGYDAMLKAEQPYSSTIKFPAKDIDVVTDISRKMGVSVHPDTMRIISRAYPVQLPSNYSCREVLGFIAAMYAGNFIISSYGYLKLVQINGIPPETRYLITRPGDAITFGGVRILV